MILSRKGFLMAEAICSLIIISIFTGSIFYIFLNSTISSKKREAYIDELYIIKSSYSIFDNNPYDLKKYLSNNYYIKISNNYIEFFDYPNLKFEIYQTNNVYNVDVFLENKTFQWRRLIYE